MAEVIAQSTNGGEMFAALNLVLDEQTAEVFDELAVQEEAAARAAETWNLATNAWLDSQQRTEAGCFDSGRLVWEDRELRDADQKAARAWDENWAKVDRTRRDLAKNLLERPGIPQFSKVAIVQALFHVQNTDRVVYATQFNTSLNLLDQSLSKGTVVYIRNGENADFYQVSTPGIDAQIVWRNSKLPSAVIKANGLIDSGVFSQDGHYDESRVWSDIELYGYEARYGHDRAQPIEALAIDKIAEEGTALYGPKFVVGEAALDVLTKDYDRSPSQALRLALAAQKQGLTVDLNGRFPQESLAYLKEQVINAMARQVMGKVVMNPEQCVGFRNERHNQGGGVVGVELDHADPAMFRQLAAITNTCELDQVQVGIAERIDALEQAILAGKEPASRLPEVQVGRLRLDSYLATLFEK